MKNVRAYVVTGAAAAMLALAGTAFAATTLTLSAAPANTGPQSTSNPCIIAATTCQQPDGMAYTDFTQKGNLPAYDEVSPTYTVEQLEGFGLTAFNVAIDVNTAQAGETLDLFEVWIGGTLAYVYTGPTLIGEISANGNGYADWLLGIVDLSGYSTGAQIYFHAEWSDSSDGGESFFLISTSTPQVPEPGVLSLLGLALLGLGAFSVRRLRKA